MAIIINSQILMERYFGKSNELQQVEQEFKKLIERYTTTSGKKVVSDFPENKAIEEILTKFFKVKRIKIYWTDKTLNACTIPTSHPFVNLKILKNYKENKTFGNEDLSIYIILDVSLIRLAKFDEKELTATVLHEIGHNFDYTPFYFLQAFPTLMIPYVGDLIKAYNNGKIELGKFVQRHLPFLYKIWNFPKKIFSFRLPFIIYIPPSLNVIANASIGYGRERFADNFAASFGYGQHLSSALRKLDIAIEGPFIYIDNPLLDFFRLLSTMSLSFIDPHPTTKTRITYMLDKIKNDLKDPELPKELKEDLENNIMYFEKYIKDYDMIVEREGKRVFTYAFEKLADKLFGGKTDYREILNFIYKKADQI